MYRLTIFLSLSIFLSCGSSKEHVTNQSETISRDTTAGQKTLSLKLDSISMPISGIAENQKGGAVLTTKNQTYWIENLTSWDDIYLNQPVRVWGEVVVRNDNPVFLDTSSVINQGIPTESKQEMKRQQSRYWIVNPKYELIRP